MARGEAAQRGRGMYRWLMGGTRTIVRIGRRLRRAGRSFLAIVSKLTIRRKLRPSGRRPSNPSSLDFVRSNTLRRFPLTSLRVSPYYGRTEDSVGGLGF